MVILGSDLYGRCMHIYKVVLSWQPLFKIFLQVREDYFAMLVVSASWLLIIVENSGLARNIDSWKRNVGSKEYRWKEVGAGSREWIEQFPSCLKFLPTILLAGSISLPGTMYTSLPNKPPL